MSEPKDNWEYYGEKDPYFAVLTFDRFKGAKLDESVKDEFFASGLSHVERIWREIEDNFDPAFRPKKALDFGCGVGRLVIPLASRCESVVGVDISERMLAEARKNCAKLGIDNAEFMQTDEFLAANGLRFDLIHSLIVFQHIKPELGVEIVQKMLDSLVEDGIGVLHFTYAGLSDKTVSFRFRLYRDHPFLYRIRNIFLSQPNEPLIPMYQYDLNKIFLMLHENGCHKSVVRFTHHGLYGALVFFQKRSEPLF